MNSIPHQAGAGTQPDGPATSQDIRQATPQVAGNGIQSSGIAPSSLGTPARAASPLPQVLPTRLVTVEEMAARLKLTREPVSGKNEWHGKNPWHGGAEKHGFWLREDGAAQDRKIPRFYKSREVAELAGIHPDTYAPIVEFKERNGLKTGGSQAGRLDGSIPGAASRNGDSPPAKPKGEPAPFSWKRARVFNYYDEGRLLFQVGRCDAPGREKSIRQRRPVDPACTDPQNAGGWVHGLGEGLYEPSRADFYPVKSGQQPGPDARHFPEARRVLYRREDVLRAACVHICEGEKAADALNDTLKAAGLYGEHVATTNPHGAGKWCDEYSADLAGKSVTVHPDNDDQGERHVEKVCPSVAPYAARLQVLRLPNLPHKGDTADFLNTGGTVEEVLAHAARAPDWEAHADAEESSSQDEAAAYEWPLLSLEDLFARPDPTWQVDLLIPTGAVVWLTASHASFKSAVALDIAMCLATGRDFHGRDAKPGRVVYVAAEGIAGIRQRAKAWLIQHQGPTPDRDRIAFIESAVQVSEAAQMNAFISQMKRLAPDFIVFDTQSRCAMGRDENSTADSTVFWDAMKRLTDATGATNFVVHHHNKNGTYRGSSNAPAAVDVHLTMERDGQRARLRCLKQKDGDEAKGHIDFTPRVVELGTFDEKGRPHTSIILRGETVSTDDFKPQAKSTDATREHVLDVLRAAPNGLRAKEWQTHVEEMHGLKSSRFYEYRDELTRPDGPVVKAGFIYKMRPESTPITPIRSESEQSERVKYSDYSDDALASEQSEYSRPSKYLGPSECLEHQDEDLAAPVLNPKEGLQGECKLPLGIQAIHPKPRAEVAGSIEGRPVALFEHGASGKSGRGYSKKNRAAEAEPYAELPLAPRGVV